MLEPSKKKSSIRRKSAGAIPWKRIFFWLAFLSFAGASAYAFFFSGFLSVKRISVSGTERISGDLIEGEIRQRLSGKYLGFIPKDNLLFAFGGPIARDMGTRYRLIESAEVSREFPDTVSIRISERHMRMILCSAGQCYYADAAGNLFPVDEFSREELDENDYSVLDDGSGKEIDPKSDVVDPGYLDFIVAARSMLKDRIGIDPERNMETPSRVSSDLRIMTSDGWKILFNRDIDADKEISMLDLVLREKIGDQRSNLDYVDLRADNKVFYKFKDGSVGQDGDQDQDRGQSSSSNSGSESADSKKKKN